MAKAVTTQERKEFANLVKRFATIQTSLKDLAKEKDVVQSKLKEALVRFGKEEISFAETPMKEQMANGNKYKFTCKRVKTTKVKYKADVMYKKLNEDVRDLVVKKNYIVTEPEKLIKLLKKYGVSKEEIKQCISITKEVDEKMLNQMGDLGEIMLADLDGCYDIVPNSDYIRVSIKDI